MKTLQITHFEHLTQEELVAVNGGSGLSTLNPTIYGLFADLSVTSTALFATLSKTLTDLLSNVDAASGSTGGSGSLLGGGLLGGGGNGLLGGGINL